MQMGIQQKKSVATIRAILLDIRAVFLLLLCFRKRFEDLDESLHIKT